MEMSIPAFHAGDRGFDSPPGRVFPFPVHSVLLSKSRRTKDPLVLFIQNNYEIILNHSLFTIVPICRV